jgi:PBP1b-binding outer membrane lipoprotein LpoB
MLKYALILATATLLAGCTGGSSPTNPAAPGSTPTTGGTKLTTLTNAELDSLIACAQTKGALGVNLATAWTGIKSMQDNMRAALKPAVEVQAKTLGCL